MFNVKINTKSIFFYLSSILNYGWFMSCNNYVLCFLYLCSEFYNPNKINKKNFR